MCLFISFDTRGDTLFRRCYDDRIEKGADVKAAAITGLTPLMLACYSDLNTC